MEQNNQVLGSEQEAAHAGTAADASRNPQPDKQLKRSMGEVVRTPGFRPTMVAVCAAFAALSLLFPTVPLAVIRATGSDALAGASTGVFMATTVATQLVTNRLLRRFGYRRVMVTSALLLGVPALWYVFALDPVSVLVVAAIRGCGFGALCVEQYALVGQIIAPSELGRASGVLGAAVGVVQMLLLPLGLALEQLTGTFAWAFGIGGAVALVAAALALWMPNISPEQVTHAKEDEQVPPGSAVKRRWPRMVRPHFREYLQTWRRRRKASGNASLWVLIAPALALSSVSMGFGAISSFLPAAAGQQESGSVLAGVILSVIGGAQVISRFGSGVLTDRLQRPGVTMLPALVMAGLGSALIVAVLALDWSAWWLLAAGLLFGGGFGMVQTESMLEMFLRVPRTQLTQASTVWNMAFDAGTGIGSFVLGFVAARQGYSWAFAVGASLVLIGLVAECVDRAYRRAHDQQYSPQSQAA